MVDTLLKTIELIVKALNAFDKRRKEVNKADFGRSVATCYTK